LNLSLTTAVVIELGIISATKMVGKCTGMLASLLFPFSVPYITSAYGTFDEQHYLNHWMFDFSVLTTPAACT